MLSSTTKELCSLQQIKGAIIGMVLGDGSLTSRNRQGCALRLCNNSVEYLKWKQEFVEKFTNTRFGKLHNGEGSYSQNDCYYLDTKVHPIYTKLRMRLYHNNKKCIDTHCFKLLTPLGILFWYLDDGTYTIHKDSKYRGIIIHSNAYTEIENLSMAKMLNDYFGLRFNVHSGYQKKRAKRYFRLDLAAKDFVKFYENIIKPYIDKIPKDLMYKIPTTEDLEYYKYKYSKMI